MSDLIDAALTLASQGLPVFPCAADKRPLTVRGFKDATQDADTIRRMFANPKAALIGVPTGPASGLVAVDIDNDPGKDGNDWHETNKYRLPETRYHLTPSGGFHAIFKLADGVRNSASHLAPGVDVRGDGGYVVWPPSPGYELAHDVEPATMPEWLLDALRKEKPSTAPVTASHDHASKYAQSALEREVGAVLTASEGTRNDALNRATFSLGQLVGAGALSRSMVEGDLARAAIAAGLDAAETAKTIRSGLEAGMQKPREIPDSAGRGEPDEDQVNPAAGLIAKANGATLEQQRKHATSIVSEILEEVDEDSALRTFLRYSLATAYSPQPFLALGAGLCLIGALAGRRYATPSDLRTNLFIISLADSSSGKDQPRKCAKDALDAAGLIRYLGGEKLGSAQSIYGSMEKHPARLFQFDEFGKMVEGMVALNAPAHMVGALPTLTTLWSSASTMVPGTEYAHQKGEKGRERVDLQQPHVCVYGSTVAQVLWDAMRSKNSDDGSLARYLVMETENNTPDLNHFPAPMKPVPADLVEQLKAIAAGVPGHDYGGNLATAMQATVAMTPYPVPYGDGVADLVVSIGNQCLEWRRQLRADGKTGAAFVGRVAEHTLRIALVCAIARDPVAPVIELRDVVWARKLVGHCVDTMMARTASAVADSPAEAAKLKILSIVKASGKDGIAKRALIRKTQWLSDARQRDAYLADMIGAETIIAVKVDGQTKPTVTYHASAF